MGLFFALEVAVSLFRRRRTGGRQDHVIEELLRRKLRVAVAVHAEVDPERPPRVSIEIPAAEQPFGPVVDRPKEIHNHVAAIVEQIGLLVCKCTAIFIGKLIESRGKHSGLGNRHALADAGVSKRFSGAAGYAGILFVSAQVRVLGRGVRVDVAALVPTAVNASALEARVRHHVERWR
jgi:hypothetical protein